MYQYRAPGTYGPPGYSAAPGAPPGMAPPPGMRGPPGGTVPVPGVAPPPGLQQTQNPNLPARPPGVPTNFQPPGHLDFNAPIIRLERFGDRPKPQERPGKGSNSEPIGNRRTFGHGADPRSIDQQRQHAREPMISMVEPTREEKLRTIFVGNITEGVGGDEGIERILRTAGGLRRFIRATDADNKPFLWGFAEYEDAQSLETAAEIFQDVEVPVKKVEPKANKASNHVDEAKKEVNVENGGPAENGVEDGAVATNGAPTEDGAAAEVKSQQEDVKMSDEAMESTVDNTDGKESTEEEAPLEKTKLIVVVDQASKDYAQEWRERRGEDPNAIQFRLDTAREALQAVLSSLFNPVAPLETAFGGGIEMQEGEPRHDPVTGEIFSIHFTPQQGEDELAEIPADQRESVLAEIAAFRDRSIRRDVERLKREEEMEAQQRMQDARSQNAPMPQPNRMAGGANGIPLGPKGDRGLAGVPSGPRGLQMPNDYQNGVTFINGSSKSSASWMSQDDEDSDADDWELEMRRQQKKKAAEEKGFMDLERRWLNRERLRTSAVEREMKREKEEDAKLATEKEQMGKRLKEWDDEVEAKKGTEEYYANRSLWLHNRSQFRNHEIDRDERDRMYEQRDKERQQLLEEQARDAANSFLNEEAERLGARMQAEAPKEPQRFKLNLGAAAAQRAQTAAKPHRTIAEVEGLLEDEEEEQTTIKRTLKPIQFDASATSAMHLSPEEQKEAAQQLARDIPTDKEGLWAWEVNWKYVDEGILARLRPFVEKKVVEYLGVQEEMLVELVEEHIKKRGAAEELVGELEGALDQEEAETLVKKLWRMLIFFSESEKRGLPT